VLCLGPWQKTRDAKELRPVCQSAFERLSKQGSLLAIRHLCPFKAINDWVEDGFIRRLDLINRQDGACLSGSRNAHTTPRGAAGSIREMKLASRFDADTNTFRTSSTKLARLTLQACAAIHCECRVVAGHLQNNRINSVQKRIACQGSCAVGSHSIAMALKIAAQFHFPGNSARSRCLRPTADASPSNVATTTIAAACTTSTSIHTKCNACIHIVHSCCRQTSFYSSRHAIAKR
jgi:hypothetical protein